MSHDLIVYLARHEDAAWMLWEEGRSTCGVRLEPGDPWARAREAVFVIWGDVGRLGMIRALGPEAVARCLEELRSMPNFDQALRPPTGLLAYLRERREAARTR